MTKPILTLSGVSKDYSGGVKALMDIHLKVYPGEFLVVIGLSGSGKTTLLRSINGLVKPTAGTVHFDGAPAQIAMIFQSFNLVPRLSALTNVLTGSLSRTPVIKSIFGAFSKSDRLLAEQSLHTVGLLDKSAERVDHLSGGQQQRIAIARALCQQPKLLLADEPVASLDPATAHSIMDYLRKANRELGVTVICNLHFLSLVREYATRVIALKDGAIVFEGLPTEIDNTWFKKIYGEEARELRAE